MINDDTNLSDIGSAVCQADQPDRLAEVRLAGKPGQIVDRRWWRIGREGDNDLVIDSDDFSSRYHAWIIFESNQFWLEDLGSTNGTILNGEPLTDRRLLADGDTIKIGLSEIMFSLLEKTGTTA